MKSSLLSDGQAVVDLLPYAEGEKGIEDSQVCWVTGKWLEKKQRMDEKHQQAFFASDLSEDEPTKTKKKTKPKPTKPSKQLNLCWKPKSFLGTQVH